MLVPDFEECSPAQSGIIGRCLLGSAIAKNPFPTGLIIAVVLAAMGVLLMLGGGAYAIHTLLAGQKGLRAESEEEG